MRNGVLAELATQAAERATEKTGCQIEMTRVVSVRTDDGFDAVVYWAAKDALGETMLIIDRHSGQQKTLTAWDLLTLWEMVLINNVETGSLALRCEVRIQPWDAYAIEEFSEVKYCQKVVDGEVQHQVFSDHLYSEEQLIQREADGSLTYLGRYRIARILEVHEEDSWLDSWGVVELYPVGVEDIH
jgi:hypothetical protein